MPAILAHTSLCVFCLGYNYSVNIVNIRLQFVSVSE